MLRLRILKVAVTTILMAIRGVVLLLLLFQDRLIYFPRRYSAAELSEANASTVQIEYHTTQGRQVAFYLKPRGAGVELPNRLWIVFVGNASCALDWLDFARAHPEARDGFLLVDYPGYGLCEGKPSPASISESGEAALRRLADELRVSKDELEKRIDVLGQSLGTGAALAFASNHSAGRIVLLAPFTSLRAMARTVVGAPLCRLLRHNFDNRARLTELGARAEQPRVEIIHGTADGTIPIAMSRTLAAEFPKMVALHEVRGSDHNTLVNDAEEQIHRLMSNPVAR